MSTPIILIATMSFYFLQSEMQGNMTLQTLFFLRRPLGFRCRIYITVQTMLSLDGYSFKSVGSIFAIEFFKNGI